MSAREHLWQIIVRCSNHAHTPKERVLARDTSNAAIDAAVRELRRTRNTARNGLDFDRWDLYDFDRGRANRRLIAEGGINGTTNDLRDPGERESGGRVGPFAG